MLGDVMNEFEKEEGYLSDDENEDVVID